MKKDVEKKMMETELKEMLTAAGAAEVLFVEITGLPAAQSQGYPRAVVFILPMTPRYLREVFEDPDYVKKRVENNMDFADDEYALTEDKSHELSDEVMLFLKDKGYAALSHSDRSLMEAGLYDGAFKETLLPNKTIALLAGIGWIGKNNLLVSRTYGCAFCLGVVLTDAL